MIKCMLIYCLIFKYRFFVIYNNYFYNDQYEVYDDLLVSIANNLPSIDQTSFSYVCQKYNAVVIKLRLQKYENVKNLIFDKKEFDCERDKYETTEFFDTEFKNSIIKLTDKEKYVSIVKYLWNKNINYISEDCWRKPDSFHSHDHFFKTSRPLIWWSALNKKSSADMAFKFIMEFGLSVKNNGKIEFSDLLTKSMFGIESKSLVPYLLIDAGVDLEQTKPFLYKTVEQYEKIKMFAKEYEIYKDIKDYCEKFSSRKS